MFLFIFMYLTCSMSCCRDMNHIKLNVEALTQVMLKCRGFLDWSLRFSTAWKCISVQVVLAQPEALSVAGASERLTERPWTGKGMFLIRWKIFFSYEIFFKIQAFSRVEQWSWMAGCFEERWWLRHYVSSIPSPPRTFLCMNKTWITAILKVHFLICKSCCADVCFPSVSSFFHIHFCFQGDRAALEEIKTFIRNEVLRVFEGTSSATTEVFSPVDEGFGSFHVCLWQNFVKTFKRHLSTLTVLQISFLPDGLQKREQLR